MPKSRNQKSRSAGAGRPSGPNPDLTGFTHLDPSGRARMVDVSNKVPTKRVAVASGEVTMQPETLALIQSHGIAKGDVLTVAKVAGILAAKRTGELIPMCHPLPLTHVAVDFTLEANTITITASASTVAPTGVEMEALTAVTVAALTIYDMCKAVDKTMRCQDIHLVSKTGGRSSG